MKKTILALAVLSLSQVSFAQSNSIDTIGNDVLRSIKETEERFTLNVEDKIICFPEYKTAFQKLKKTVLDAGQDFEKSLMSEQAKLNAQVNKELTEYKSVEALAKRDPSNAAYQNLLKLKKDQLTQRMDGAKTKFTQAYEKMTKIYLSKASHIGNIPVDFQAIKDRFYNGDKAFSIFPSNLVDDSVGSTFLVGKSSYQFKKTKDDYRGLVLRHEKGFPSLLVRSLSNQENKIFMSHLDGCKTAGCVYLLSEQLKTLASSLKSLDLSIHLSDGPISLTHSGTKINFPEARLHSAIDTLANKAAEKLPIGNLTPACSGIDQANAHVSQTARENIKDLNLGQGSVKSSQASAQ